MWLHSARASIPGMQLDDYIAARAERGCADCISTILECPEDASLLAALAYNARKISVDMLVEELKILGRSE